MSKRPSSELTGLPASNASGDKASSLSSLLSGSGQRPVSSAAAASAVGKDDISGGGIGSGEEGFSCPLFVDCCISP
jgi:hypothetical protein